LKLSGLKLLRPVTHGDSRGSLTEVWNQELFRILGIHEPFVQDNWTVSRRGALRGMHYQIGSSAHAKLVRCAKGKIADAVVDLRRSSATFGQVELVELGDDPFLMLYVPKGMAHGFLTISEEAWISYKLTHPFCVSAERGISALDPKLQIPWPDLGMQLEQSPKDRGLPCLQEQPDVFP